MAGTALADIKLASTEIEDRAPVFNYAGPDIRLLQKREKVAALDLRFQRYRKAEP
jgi:hypothetical protein